MADVERVASHVAVMQQGRVVASGAVEDWQRTMRRVQVVVAGDEVPSDVEVPGTLRARRLGPVLTAVARVLDDAQLDSLRARPGVRVHVFPMSMEEWFVEVMESRAEPGNEGLQL